MGVDVDGNQVFVVHGVSVLRVNTGAKNGVGNLIWLLFITIMQALNKPDLTATP
jgi:hypothetical protein